MMMPANYSVIAENEMTYVGGGSWLLNFLGDNLPELIPNTKKLTTNLVNIIANTFVSDVLKTTVGVMFGGNWGTEKVADAWSKAFVKADALNTTMSVIGNMAAIYQLATKDVKTVVADTKLTING